MVTLDSAIKSFAKFLNSSWDIVLPLLLNGSYTLDESSIGDWMQANWELLVERKLLAHNEYIEIYGAGADFNGASSRITDPEALPNFRISINSKNSTVYDYLSKKEITLQNCVFNELVSFKNDFYKTEPNFEYVLLDEKNIERVLKLSDITFKLIPYK